MAKPDTTKTQIFDPRQPPAFLTKAEAAAALRLSIPTINRRLASGDLIARRLGGRVLIEGESIRALVSAAPVAEYRSATAQ